MQALTGCETNSPWFLVREQGLIRINNLINGLKKNSGAAFPNSYVKIEIIPNEGGRTHESK
jgi:hypothetical protein